MHEAFVGVAAGEYPLDVLGIEALGEEEAGQVVGKGAVDDGSKTEPGRAVGVVVDEDAARRSTRDEAFAC